MVEVPIPFAGTITELHAQAGESVAVGAPLISVSEPRSALSQRAPCRVGYRLERTDGGKRRRGPRLQARRQRRGSPHRVAVVSPLVRQLARDHGLDLTTRAAAADRTG